MVKKIAKITSKKEAKKIVANKKITTKEVVEQRAEKNKKAVAINIKKVISSPAPVVNETSERANFKNEFSSSESQTQKISDSEKSKELIINGKDKIIKNDHTKAIIMWACVFSFMVVIIIIWAYNFKIIFESEMIVTDSNTNDQIRQLSAQVRDNMNQFKKDIAEIRNINTSTTTERNDLFQSASSTMVTATSSVDSANASSTLGNPDIKQIKKLKSSLEQQNQGKPNLE